MRTPFDVSSQSGLAGSGENVRLHRYEESVKQSFDDIVPTLKRVSSLQHSDNFVSDAQNLARQVLGYELPDNILQAAWLGNLDVKALYAWCVFKTYWQFCDDFFKQAPLASGKADEFQQFLEDCGFHTLDISPCADGRMAHVIRYVLRLPIESVRRKSYAGGVFDIDNSIQKWVETELSRFREGRPNNADKPTRYLKAVAYHLSSVDATHEGCAAHGSNDGVAALQGMLRLQEFREAIENSFCCGASIDLLLIGVDTATDAIRVHIPNANGDLSVEKYLDTKQIHRAINGLSAEQGNRYIEDKVRELEPDVCSGMLKLISHLMVNNLSQIDYVNAYFNGQYNDIGHAERLIGVGVGFEEVQLRNLTYLSYLNTVEENTQDLDVGIKIFSKANVSNGLPVPIVVRFDYHGQVPGARERAIERCKRIEMEIGNRYEELKNKGLLHVLSMIRDCNGNNTVEIIGSSINASFDGGLK